MTRRILTFLITFFFVILALPISGLAKNYVQYFGNGKIDWSHRMIEAIGLAYPPKNPINRAQSRALTKSEAEAQARNHLLDIIREMKIDSKNLVRDYMEQSDFPFADFHALLRRAEVVDIAYLDNGCVKSNVFMSLAGSFSELFLPKNILDIDQIQQPQEANKKEDAFSGLVVDCRGLPLKPAMVPVILDEDGHVIYGSAYVSRDHAVQMGVVSYVKDLSAAQRNPRVTPRPLTLKAIRVLKGRETDVVISNADGAKIKGIPSNLSFLHKGRVLIVLD